MPVIDFETDISIAKWSMQVEWEGTVSPHRIDTPPPVLIPFESTTVLPEYPQVVPGNKDLGVKLRNDTSYHYGTWRGRFDVETAYGVPGSRVVYKKVHWQSTKEDLGLDGNPLVDVEARARIRTGDLGGGGDIEYGDWSHDDGDYEHWYQDDNDIVVESGRFLEVECYFVAHVPCEVYYDSEYFAHYGAYYCQPSYFDYHYYDQLNTPEEYYDPGYYDEHYYVPALHNLTVDFAIGPQSPEVLSCVIQDVCARQVIGTTTVQVTYILQSATNRTVELEVVDADGNPLAQPQGGELTGDVGSNVAPGTRTISWSIGDGTSYDGSYIEDIRVIVGARHPTYVDSTCHATSNLFTIDSKDPSIYGIRFSPIVVCAEDGSVTLTGKTYFRVEANVFDDSVIRWVKFEYDIDGTNYHVFYSDEFSAASSLVYEVKHDFDLTADGEIAFTATSYIFYKVTVEDIWGNSVIVESSVLAFNDPPESPTSLTVDGTNCPAHTKKTVPTFGWTYNDPNPGDRQGAWRIQVNTKSDFSGFMFWDSGQVFEPLVNGFHQRLASDGPPEAYFGQEGSHHSLIRCHTFYWRVKTWDMRNAEGPWSDACELYIDSVTVTVDHGIPFRTSWGIVAPEVVTPEQCDQLAALTTVEGMLDISSWSLEYQECLVPPSLKIEIYADGIAEPIAEDDVTIQASDFDRLNSGDGGIWIDGVYVPNGYYGGFCTWSVDVSSHRWIEGAHTLYAKMYEVGSECRSEASSEVTFVLHSATPSISLKTRATNNQVINGTYDVHSPIADPSHLCYVSARSAFILVAANGQTSTGVGTTLGEWSSTVTSLIDHSLNTVEVSITNAAGLSHARIDEVIYETNVPKIYVNNFGVISTRKLTGTFLHDGDGDDNYSPGVSEIRVNGLLATFSETFAMVGSNRISYGTWEITLPSLHEGINKVMLEIVDKAGNRSRGYRIVEGEGYAGEGRVLVFLDTHKPTGVIVTTSPTNVQVVRGSYTTEGVSPIVRARIRAADGSFVDLL